MENCYFDLTVVGAGFSGVCAAIAAARKGLKVALIGDRPVFGGNCSSEIGIWINGAAANGNSHSVYSREGGITEELKLAMAYYKSRDIAYFEKIYKEPNISSFLNTLVVSVETDHETIKAVNAVQLSSERRFRFESPLFIDSSGDGFVAFSAGAEFMSGREPRSQFKESIAPLEADNYTMGSSMGFRSVYRDYKVEYHRPGFAYNIKETAIYKNLGKGGRGFRRPKIEEFNGFWWIEYGGQVDTIRDSEDIALELRKIVYGLWDYIKNSGEFKDVDNLELTRVMPIPGKRESRRFVGEYILTQNDVDQKVDFEDSVGMAGWEMDIHAPKGIYDDGPATVWHFVAGNYNIPFGMMIPKTITNLMLAGRNMSATHVAFGSTRVACTGGVAGQAVGTAAYLCKKYNKPPSLIRKEHMNELSDLLLNSDQSIVNRKEPGNQELIRDTVISASSVKEYANDGCDKIIALSQDTGLCLPVRTTLDSYKVKIKNNGGATALKVLFYGGNRPENYIPESLLKEIAIDIPQGFDDWILIPVGLDASPDMKLYSVFKKNESLSLYGTDDRLTGVISFVAGEHDAVTSAKYKGCMRIWRTRKEAHLDGLEVCFKDVLPEQDIYSPQNLVNGYSRPYGLANNWISQPGGCASVNIKFTEPKRLSEIQLVFNTMLEEDNIETFVPACIIKDYVMEIRTKQKTETFDIKNNFMRVNYFKLDLEDVVSIRINLINNFGSKYFEMYGIKLF